jgi:hypothetical protein
VDGNKLVAVVYGGVGNSGGIYTLQSVPMPRLNISHSSTNLMLSWLMPSTNFVLQQNSDLTTTNWTTLTNLPAPDFTNLQEKLTLLPTNYGGFFRLISQ